MNFTEITEKRYSCRGYSKEQVKREDILEILRAGSLSPSACNSQPWHYVVVDEEDKKAEIAKATQKGAILGINKFTSEASAFIVIVGEKPAFSAKLAKIMTDREYVQYDIGITAVTMCYKATELGLGTCIMGWYDEDKIKKCLSVPDKKSVELVLALGYPKEDIIPQKRRKDFDKIHSFNGYGEKDED